MRFKGYKFRASNGEICHGIFTAEHYKYVGLPYSPNAGMSQLEAYTLINNWNCVAATIGLHRICWLDESEAN